PPGREQRPLGMGVGVDESRADHTPRRQVDHLTAGRWIPGTDRGYDRPVDQDVARHRGGADPVGDQAAAKHHRCRQRPIPPPGAWRAVLEPESTWGAVTNDGAGTSCGRWLMDVRKDR